jgi:uncharacterized membrane protein required for colicin V production
LSTSFSNSFTRSVVEVTSFLLSIWTLYQTYIHLSTSFRFFSYYLIVESGVGNAPTIHD